MEGRRAVDFVEGPDDICAGLRRNSRRCRLGFDGPRRTRAIPASHDRRTSTDRSHQPPLRRQRYDVRADVAAVSIRSEHWPSTRPASRSSKEARRRSIVDCTRSRPPQQHRCGGRWIPDGGDHLVKKKLRSAAAMTTARNSRSRHRLAGWKAMQGYLDIVAQLNPDWRVVVSRDHLMWVLRRRTTPPVKQCRRLPKPPPRPPKTEAPVRRPSGGASHLSKHRPGCAAPCALISAAQRSIR